MAPPIVEAADLKKSYKIYGHKIEVLRGLNLSVNTGEWISLMGQSGCGKTTLLRILGALDKPDSGNVICKSSNITQLSSLQKAKFRRRQIGFIFQNYQLFTELNAFENVMLPGQLANQTTKEIQTRASELLVEVGMIDRKLHRPAELSGGEQQRIAIARALMNRPSIILADEPTGNLDDKSSKDIMDILLRLQSEENKTIIVVSHDQRVREFSNRSYIIKEGILDRI